ncbi:hypothetical protein LCGC14_2621110 [marine sediment metagenome]|uniref:Uncharacterized protein n=1 Tax=marine sediment metagenome TaxID=412755 RepID=A0A0F8VB30_9ZZZZ
MKIYYTSDFKGQYPVGTSAVIIAHNKTHATKLLKEALENDPIGKLEIIYGDKHGKPMFIEIDLNKPDAFIINDGNY